MEYTAEQLADIEAKRIAAVEKATAEATVKAAKEATDATRAAMIAELGGDPKEAARALKASQKAATEAQTEIEKATAARVEAEARASAAEAEANSMRKQSTIVDALVEAGVNPAGAKALAPSVMVPDGADGSVIEAAIEVLKGKLGPLFAPAEEPPVGGAPAAAPIVNSHPDMPKPPAGQTKMSEGAALFAAANPHLVNN